MTGQSGKQEPDADILAIRELLNDAEAVPATPATDRVTASPAATDLPPEDMPPARAIAGPAVPQEAVDIDTDIDEAIREMVDDGQDAVLTQQIRSAGKVADRVVSPAPRKVPAPVARAVERLRAYRPTPRHIGLAAFALLVVLRPWLVVVLLVLPVVIVVGIFLFVGYDRFWSGVLRLFRWYHARRPAKAERLRRRADGLALRWDAFLDRLPEGSVDALYLPDLNSLQEREDRHKKALAERFDKLQDEAGAQ